MAKCQSLMEVNAKPHGIVPFMLRCARARDEIVDLTMVVDDREVWRALHCLQYRPMIAARFAKIVSGLQPDNQLPYLVTDPRWPRP